MFAHTLHHKLTHICVQARHKQQQQQQPCSTTLESITFTGALGLGLDCVPVKQARELAGIKK